VQQSKVNEIERMGDSLIDHYVVSNVSPYVIANFANDVLNLVAAFRNQSQIIDAILGECHESKMHAAEFDDVASIYVDNVEQIIKLFRDDK
jgi:hypothetical protein